jgi:ketosteroid isomerase-like protein
MMSATLMDNKRTAIAFMDALTHWDWVTTESMMTEDAIYWIAGSTAVSGQTNSRQEYISQAKRLFGAMTEVMAVDYGDITAEDDRVALEMRSRLTLPDGRIYQNHYHILFTVRDGRIASVREFMDTQHVGELFG